MKHKYYVDESGNTGDLVRNSVDLTFSNQPIFSLSSIGINDLEKAKEYISSLKIEFNIQGGELKSNSIYKSKPKFLFEICKYVTNEQLPFFIEVVDKKYFITTSIVNNLIFPPYFSGDESDGKVQTLRNMIADYLSREMPVYCYQAYFYACLNPSEDNLFKAMDSLKVFFLSRKCSDTFRDIYIYVEETLDDYQILKSKFGEDALYKFLPIPDLSKRGKKIQLLPHVASLMNVIARTNLFENGNSDSTVYIHDNQAHFDELLINAKSEMVNLKLSGNEPPILNANFNINDAHALKFADSLDEIGIQISDLLAGFSARYFNEFTLNIENIYHDIYLELRKSFNPVNSVGLNLVIPETYRNGFEKFHWNRENNNALQMHMTEST